ncbi:MAG TPA: SMC-Scp complex subunit ScpB [Terriglobales bacterium]|nr:SMC-Scp complex subunit ScpB [Terriglobales bacterium]
MEITDEIFAAAASTLPQEKDPLMSTLKGKVEAIIYAAEEPVTIDQMANALRDVVDIPVPEAAPLPPDSKKKLPKDPKLAALKDAIRNAIHEISHDYSLSDRGIEVRQVAGGYKMATKPEHHDVVRTFAKSLKPPVRLSLQALETLAVIAYKQPVTLPEINEIRNVDSSGVIGTLLDRKLITTAGRKDVVGRPILYKTTKDFLMRFGLKDVGELPSVEEFEKLGAGGDQPDLFTSHMDSDATGVPDVPAELDTTPEVEPAQ